MEEIKAENVYKLLQMNSSEKLLIKALKGLKVERKDRISRIILITICGMISFIIGFCKDTIIVLQDSTDVILNVLLAFSGMIFTGYALLQAFMNKQLLLQLLRDVKKEGDEEKSRLQDVNENFICLMLLYVITIIVTLILKIVLFCTPNEFIIFKHMLFNNIVASVLCMIYFSIVGIILWRTISFVASIFNLFNAYAVAQIIEILDDGSKTDA